MALIVDYGVVLFIAQGDGMYEVSANFYPVARGTYAKRVIQDAIRWMFVNTDCLTLFARVPATNKAAERACRDAGGVREFDRKAVWPSVQGPVDMSFWTLRYDQWIGQASDFIESGVLFFERLTDERRRLGYEALDIAREECVYRHAGAASEMILAGMLDKGVILYNRWAIIAGYQRMALVARTPALIDTGDMVLQIVNGAFKAIKCRS